MDTHTKIHLGYIENSPQIGGANRSSELLLEGLQSTTRYVPHFSCPCDGPMVDLVTKKEIQVDIHKHIQPSYTNPIKSYLGWRQWEKFCSENQLQLIHANGLFGARSVTIAAWRKKLPLLCHIRFPADAKTCKWVFHRLPKPTGFIFISKSIQKEMGPHLKENCPNSKQWVVHNGVDLKKFSPPNSIATNQIPHIGIVANLQVIKGHEDFFDMATILKKTGFQAHYNVIGDDIQNQNRMESLREYVTKRGLENNVTFHGYVTNVHELMYRMDILICPSHIEPFGRVLIEAMACGKPVIGSSVGGIPEIVVDGETGFLVPPHSPKTLAERTVNLLEDRNKCKHFGQAGRHRVENHFSAEAYIEKVLYIYQEVLTKKNI